MTLSRKNHSLLKKFGFIILTVLLVGGGSLFQQRVLQVNATVQVLLVSRTAIAFGDVFPGEHPSETYTVQLDTSANSATYATTLDPLPGLQNLCPFLNLHSIDSPAEPDTLPASRLERPGDVLDKWQVQLSVPGIKGELSQDHDGGIIVQGGNFGCKITITTVSVPGKIIICKKSAGDTGTFNFTGDLGPFNIRTALSSQGNQGTDNNNSQDPCSGSQPPCGGGSWNQTAGSDSGITDTTKCITNTTVTNINGAAVTNIISSNSNSGGVVVGSGSGDINNSSIVTGNSVSTVYVGTSVNSISSTVNLGAGKNNGGGGKIFDNLDPGTYQVAETAQDGWNLTSLVCHDPSLDSKVNQNSASIKLASGETVICTFVNTKKKGTVIIQKKTVGGDGKFYFSGDLGSFVLQTAGNTASQTFGNLNAGSYKITENAQDGWDFTSLVCVDPDNNTTISKNSANVKLAAGETVTCTFTNTQKKKGKIIIQKNALGGNGSFNFSGDLGGFSLQTSGGTGSKAFDNLNAGTYKVSESQALGWKLNSLVCTDPSHDTIMHDSDATIKLASGETVTCVFTNKKKSKIIIHKKTGGDDDSCDFSGDLGHFSLPTHLGSGSLTFDNLDGGTYNISENAKGNWSPSSVVCTGASGLALTAGSAKINLGDGQTVDCTFTNSKKK